MTSPCKYCGSTLYVVQLVYHGVSQELAVVQCDECHRELIPVVVNHFTPQAEAMKACEKAWNKAQA